MTSSVGRIISCVFGLLSSTLGVNVGVTSGAINCSFFFARPAIIDSILAGRAKKNEQLITPEVTPSFTPSFEETNPNKQEIVLPTDEVITVGEFQ